jgi:hypothetical protein
MRLTRRTAIIMRAIAVGVLLLSGHAAIQTANADEKELATWWKDLEGQEAVAARALLKLAARPDETVRFLKGKMKPLKIEESRVRKLLADLGSDKQEVWDPAYEEMEYFDPRLAIDLVTLMADITTSPARERMVELLSQRPVGSLVGKEVNVRPLGGGGDGYNFFDGRASWWAEHRVERINLGGNMKKKWTQAVRAIVLLEHLGTPDAVAILKEMATGHPEAQPTRTAQEALERIAGKPADDAKK